MKIKFRYRLSTLLVASALSLAATTMLTGCLANRQMYEDGMFDDSDFNDSLLDNLERNNDLDLDNEEHN
ncbi:MAG: hypothetical protein IJ835_02060 [Muribaculaceae bacterium]|nr:hypothetical protein [Muribaculaceae bacterium]